MINIKINEENYEMASGWDEVSYEKYIELAKLKEADTITMMVECIRILSNIPEDLIMSADMSDLFSIPITWIFEPVEKKNEFIMNGEIYKVKDDLNKLSISEYISLSNYLKGVDDYDKLIAIILRKEGEKYDSEIILEKAKLVRENLKGDDIKVITDFFLVGEQGLIKTLTTYFQTMMMKVKM